MSDAHDLSSYTKFCGLGVTSEGMTPYGIQVRLIQSSVPTLAQMAGLRDGDIIQGMWRGDTFMPIRDTRDYFGLLGGLKDEDMPMQIVRGVPLPPSPSAARSRGPTTQRWEGVPVQTFDITARRNIVYPYLPPGVTPDEHALIEWRSPDEFIACMAVGKLEVDDAAETELAELAPLAPSSQTKAPMREV